MTAKTFTSAGVNNLWSNAANWDLATAPVDNDSVTIPTGQTCEFDVDWSSAVTYPNGLAGLTVTGTGMFKVSRSTSSYLKMKAAATISGTGKLDFGASTSDKIPFAVKHTLAGGASYYVNNMDNTITVYGTEPTIPYVRCTGAEAAGQTVLEVDTDVTGDIWADGDEVWISDVNTGDAELRVIAAGGRAAGAITITAGLTNAKIAGALVILKTRNVTLTGNGGYKGIFYQCDAITFGSADIEGSNQTYGFSYCNNLTISGGIISEVTRYVNYGENLNLTGGVFVGVGITGNKGTTISGGMFTGCDSGKYPASGTAVTISGGTFTGNNRCVAECQAMNITGGTFTGNTYGVIQSTGTIKNASFSENTSDLINAQVWCYNTLFDSTTENSNYNTLARETYSESIDHDQTGGAFRAWTKGGITSSATATPPTGYTAYKSTALESATSEGFWQKEVLVSAGASVTIHMNLRKDASMTYLPRCIVFNKASTDPFAGGAGLNTFTMTDSVDTWEDSDYTYTNTGSAEVTLVIRFQGMNATGTMLSAALIDVLNVDLTSVLANLAIVDGIVDAIKAKTDNLPSDPADQSAVEAAITAGIATIDTDSVLAATVEGAYTVQDVLKLMASVMAGKVSGGGTTSVTFRDLSDALDRVTATVDTNGNRTDLTFDLT